MGVTGSIRDQQMPGKVGTAKRHKRTITVSTRIPAYSLLRFTAYDQNSTYPPLATVELSPRQE